MMYFFCKYALRTLINSLTSIQDIKSKCATKEYRFLGLHETCLNIIELNESDFGYFSTGDST